MGTRSLTVFTDEYNDEVVVMYRQFDGYIEGHGLALAEFLNGMEMVNGLIRDDRRVANGMGCLAAQVVAHFKDAPGGFYLYPAGTRDAGEEYRYEISGETGSEPTVKAVSVGWNSPDSVLFDGPASEFLEYAKSSQD